MLKIFCPKGRPSWNLGEGTILLMEFKFMKDLSKGITFILIAATIGFIVLIGKTVWMFIDMSEHDRTYVSQCAPHHFVTSFSNKWDVTYIVCVDDQENYQIQKVSK